MNKNNLLFLFLTTFLINYKIISRDNNNDSDETVCSQKKLQEIYTFIKEKNEDDLFLKNLCLELQKIQKRIKILSHQKDLKSQNDLKKINEYARQLSYSYTTFKELHNCSNDLEQENIIKEFVSQCPSCINSLREINQSLEQKLKIEKTHNLGNLLRNYCIK